MSPRADQISVRAFPRATIVGINLKTAKALGVNALRDT
jgi:hypothetical protein